jgi:CDP-diacylglycerol--serine O-phosphatidyltransferase
VSDQRPQHFSMIRDFALADVLTLGNAFCGSGSVFAAIEYVATRDRHYMWLAIGLLPIALVLDVLDGTVARWRRKASPLGADLDSLADVVSFGVAPAALGFSLGLRGGWDVLVLIYFVACGISRLARFNVTAAALADEKTGKVKYFEGTPIPTSLALVAVLAVLAWQGRIGDDLALGAWKLGPMTLHPLVVMYALSGSAMISKTLRIPKP